MKTRVFKRTIVLKADKNDKEDEKALNLLSEVYEGELILKVSSVARDGRSKEATRVSKVILSVSRSVIRGLY